MSSATQRDTVTRRVQRLTWPSIFVGIVLLSLGLSVRRGDAALGWGIAATGTLLIVVGAVLIWVRSRLPEPEPDPRHDAKKAP